MSTAPQSASPSNRLRQWLQQALSPRTVQSAGQTGPASVAGAIAPSPDIPQLIELDAKDLLHERLRAQQLERDTFQRLRSLQASITGLAARDAEARLGGSLVERQGLLRLYEGLRTQRLQTQLLHEDLSLYLRLLDKFSALATARQLTLGARLRPLAEGRLAEAVTQVGHELAAHGSRRAAWREFLRDWDLHLEDAVAQADAALDEADAELSALSDAAYQQMAQARLDDLQQTARPKDAPLAAADQRVVMRPTSTR